METERAYEVLGLHRSASFREVMEAHRDLVQVWDPRRFHENLRLQRRAIQEMASINEAFDTLRIQAMQGQLPHTNASGPGPQATALPAAHSVAPGGPSDDRSASARTSLYDDALPKRGKRPRFLGWLPLITGVILAILVAAWILRSDSDTDISDEATSTPAAAESGVAPVIRPEPSETPAPGKTDESQPSTPSAASPAEKTVPDSPGMTSEPDSPLVRRAFQLLREKSISASILLRSGRFENLRFEGWQPLRGDIHEFQLQLVAIREPNGDKVRLVWSVNLDTGTVNPLNDAARELEDRSAGPKPQLIRQM